MFYNETFWGVKLTIVVHINTLLESTVQDNEIHENMKWRSKYATMAHFVHFLKFSLKHIYFILLLDNSVSALYLKYNCIATIRLCNILTSLQGLDNLIFFFDSHIAVNACLAPLCSMHGLAVTTVEGIGSIKTRLHPVQVRFLAFTN